MPPKNQLIHFELFRYQLLPWTQNVQMDLFPSEKFKSINTVAELKKRKNEIFHHILEDFPPLQHRQSRLNVKVDMNSPPWFVIEINTPKLFKRDKPNFDQENIGTWPPVTVIINNRPDMQIIAVSRNIQAFSSGKTVVEILRKNLAPILQRYHLSIHIEALFVESEFWNLVKKYQDQISSVDFELVSPNMANISGAVKLEINIAKLNADTNSHRTNLTLNSAEGSTLDISSKNTLVNGIVDYSSKGGGDIKLRVKIKGYKRTIRTSKNIQKLDINKVFIENLSPEQLEKFFEIIE